MSTTLKVILENGVFKPLEPLALKEHRSYTITLDDREVEDDLIGMFADEPSLMDEVVEAAMTARDKDPLRRPAL